MPDDEGYRVLTAQEDMIEALRDHWPVGWGDVLPAEVADKHKAPPHLRKKATRWWEERWWGIMSIAVQDAVAAAIACTECEVEWRRKQAQPLPLLWPVANCWCLRQM